MKHELRNKLKPIIYMVVISTFLILLSLIYDLKTQYNKLVETTSVVLSTNDQLIEELETLQNKYTNLDSEYSELSGKYTILSESTQGLLDSLDELDEELKTLSKANDEYYEALQEFSKREELFNKYEYAVYTEEHTRTDLTYDQLQLAEEVCEKNNVDVNLLLATIMTESNGEEKCISKISTARGYGQILRGTGEFVYNRLMKKSGKYYHSYALNGNTNITMMAYYMGYLKKRNNNIYTAIDGYRGLNSKKYKKSINKYLKKAGTSLAKLNKTY